MKTPTTKQREAAATMVDGKWVCLFGKPGSGKTLTAITALKTVLQDAPASHVLVIAPKIALRQWQRELKEQGIGAAIFRKEQDFRLLDVEPVVITTWGLMTRKFDKLRHWGPDVIIGDEAHACIDHNSERTIAFYGRNGDGTGLATMGEYLWPLTGTPVVRYADDLWPMLSALVPDLLRKLVGSIRRHRFAEKFVLYRTRAIPHPKNPDKKIIIDEPYCGMNEDLLNSALYDGYPPLAIRDLGEDSELPPTLEREIEIELSDDWDESLIAHLTDKELIEETEEVVSARRAFGRAKVKGAADYINSLKEPVLVLTWHQDVADALSGLIAAEVIDGRTSEKARSDALENFMDGNMTKLIGQIGAVGTALDGLQHVARRVVFVERIGSPALMAQAIARLERRGQMTRVQADYLVAAGHRLEWATDQKLRAKTKTQIKAIG